MMEKEIITNEGLIVTETERVPLNVYQKIQALRLTLQESHIKKSGKNKFQDYSYYELQDFLPLIVRGCEKRNLYTQIDFKPDLATLTVINANNPQERVTFETTVASVELKGGQAMQNLGAMQTYLRRYLYMNAFEIVQCDDIDSQEPATSAPSKQNESMPAAPAQTPAAPAGGIPACAKCGKKMYKSKFDDSYYCSDFKVCKQKWWPPKTEAVAAAPQPNDEPPAYVDEDIPF